MCEPISTLATPSTSNALIHGLGTFIGKAGTFDATLRTSAGPVEVLVPQLTIGAALSQNAWPSNVVVSLVLPASFEARI